MELDFLLLKLTVYVYDFAGHLDRRTRTVHFQIKDSHVQQVMLNVLQQTASPYTSLKYDKSWIQV